MEQSEEYQEAKRKVTKLRGFHRHLGLFVIINAVLIILNLIMSPGNFWFYWVTLFWGIAIVWQAYDVFGNPDAGEGVGREEDTGIYGKEEVISSGYEYPAAIQPEYPPATLMT